MRGKPVTLASAGPRLTGPPEGYGRKKELQVKHWLTSAQPATDVGAPDITTEPSLYPNQSLDDVYKQLRDSTDRIPAFFVAKTDPAEPTAAGGFAPFWVRARSTYFHNRIRCTYQAGCRTAFWCSELILAFRPQLCASTHLQHSKVYTSCCCCTVMQRKKPQTQHPGHWRQFQVHPP